MEPHSINYHRSGWIEMVCGPMFSGKTEELIRRLRRAKIARQQVEIFKPALDDRYSRESVVSHDETSIKSVPVDTAEQILLLSANAQVVGIDEAQFFGPELIRVCQILANQGKRVVIAGLDLDYRGVPFEPVPQLMAIAEYVSKLHAVCMVCGGAAIHSQRIIHSSKRFIVGSKASYEPRCRHCFKPPSEKTTGTTRKEKVASSS